MLAVAVVPEFQYERPPAVRFDSARRAAAGLADRIRSARSDRHADRLARRVDRSPQDVALLGEYARLLESKGERRRAGEVFAKLALLNARAGDFDAASFCTRKFEHYGYAGATGVYRELASLLSAAGRYAEAARCCTRVAEHYIEDGHSRAVAGYARQLPPLGPHAAATRAALDALAGVAIEQEPEPAEAVHSSGTLGRTTVYDLLQSVEIQGLTGRLDVEDGARGAHVYFLAGRIVAARRGTERGMSAARHAFGLRTGAYTIVTTDTAPPDELRVPNTTSLLLDVMRDFEATYLDEL